MSAVFNNFYLATQIADQLIEADSVRDFLERHGIARTRTLSVRRDPSQDGYFQIPVFDHGASRSFVSLFKPGDNPRLEFKERVQQLVLKRPGFHPGDVFVTPWGRFLVTDVKGIKEI